MRAFRQLIAGGALFLFGFAAQALELRAEWRDAGRNRTVPVKVFAPRGTAAAPVILFSHGLGGSREGGSLWGEHWASRGYLVIHLQHPGSDEAVARQGLQALKQAATGRELEARTRDVRFALDELQRRHAAGEAPFAQADLARIGLAGHSFGAVTTLAVAGQAWPRAGAAAAPDPRIKAAIAFSPNAHERAGPLDQQFGGIHIPVLLLTGTRDGDIVGDGTTPEGRARVYDFLPGPAKVLAIFEGGDHMVFGGHVMRRPATPTDRVIQDAVRELSGAFWDAHLRGDPRARDWLAGEARSKMGALGQYRAP